MTYLPWDRCLCLQYSRYLAYCSYALFFSAITCTVPTVDYANQNPQSSTIDYNTNIIYTCQTGYSHTEGHLIRSCKADGSLSGSTPVCTRKFAGNALALFQIIFKMMFILTF